MKRNKNYRKLRFLFNINFTLILSDFSVLFYRLPHKSGKHSILLPEPIYIPFHYLNWVSSWIFLDI